MGSYSLPDHSMPFLKPSDMKKAWKSPSGCGGTFKRNRQLIQGVMYGGFIATKKGARLLEYNARFGDPEAMNILPL